MPLEIRELVIKTSVNSQSGGNHSSAPLSGEAKLSSEDQKRIIASCVEQVLAALRLRRER